MPKPEFLPEKGFAGRCHVLFVLHFISLDERIWTSPRADMEIGGSVFG